MSEHPKPATIRARITVEIDIDPELTDAIKGLARLVRRTVSDANVAAVVSTQMKPKPTEPEPAGAQAPAAVGPMPEVVAPAAAPEPCVKPTALPRRPQRPVVTDPKVPNVAPIAAPAGIAAIVMAETRPAASEPDPVRPEILTINDVPLVTKRAIHSYKSTGRSAASIARSMGISLDIVKQILAGRRP